jgi:hypothetical protein
MQGEVSQSSDPVPRRRTAEENRDAWIDPVFTLRGHLLKVGATATVIVSIGVALAWDAPAWQWAMIPVFWLIANVFEAAIHRWPMHRPLFPRMLYEAHTKIHHFAYETGAMEIRDSRDLNLVMMPWYTLILVFAMASPIIAAVTLLGGWSMGGMFLIAAVIYFLIYETIHTLHHLRQVDLDRTWWGRGRWLVWLRAHHHHHHDHRHMRHTNFNVTFPLGDLVMRTYFRD